MSTDTVWNEKDAYDQIKQWQVETMGNTCSVCYGNNIYTACSACGWWGKVKPKVTP